MATRRASAATPEAHAETIAAEAAAVDGQAAPDAPSPPPPVDVTGAAAQTPPAGPDDGGTGHAGKLTAPTRVRFLLPGLDAPVYIEGLGTVTPGEERHVLPEDGARLVACGYATAVE